MALAQPALPPEAAEEAFVYSKNTVWKRFRRHRLAMAGAIVLLLLVLIAVFAPWVTHGIDPNAIDNKTWVGDPVAPCFQDAVHCGGHALGLDENGRDMFARLIFGARISLTVGVAAVIVELIIGTILGAIAGYFRNIPWMTRSRVPLWASYTAGAIGALIGFYEAYRLPIHADWLQTIVAIFLAIVGSAVLFLLLHFGASELLGMFGVPQRRFTVTIPIDYVIMRVTDVFLSIPLLPLMLTLTGIVAAMSTKASLDFKTIVLIIGLLSWPGVARLVRATYLSLREREYTEAARAVGNRDGRIIFRHLLPNAMAPLTVQATLDVANVIVLESTLSFLGFGIQPPTASWGNMLANAESNLEVAWWAAVFPGLCILITVLAINYIGDGLRDALDPNMR